MRRGISLTGFLLVISSLAAGAQEPARQVVVYDTGTARSLGMGSAFTAYAQGTEAILWNPAGIALATERQLSYGDGLKSDPKTVRFAGYVQPGNGAPSGGVFYLRVDNKTFGVRENSLGYSFGQMVAERVAVGGNLKYSRFRRPGESKQTFNIDLGVLYNVTDTATLGVAVLNAGNPRILDGQPVPGAPPLDAARLVNVGAAWRLHPYVAAGQLGIGPREYQTTVTFDVFDATEEVRRQLRFGVEHRITAQFVARAGLLSSNPTVGAGVRFRDYEINGGVLFGRPGHRTSEVMLSLSGRY